MIIFLDIDGVLIHEKFISLKYAGQIPKDQRFCLNAINNLKQLKNKINAEIVISSTWREDKSKDDLIKLFKNFDIPVTDVTNPKLNKREAILEYIQLNNIKDYLILDDENLELPNQKIIDPNFGL